MDGWVMLLLVAFGLWVQYAIIKAAVYRALTDFLREAARSTGMREGYDVPRLIDQLAVHLTGLTRPPPDK
ncbi:hypothetical protein [Actinoplanes sp. NPDC049316]|uniref:hypothetical protein n=1 Tax=Actinoplanes sp. NPDC049316 TaxID=3154727 RepID=UPI00341A8D78